MCCRPGSSTKKFPGFRGTCAVLPPIVSRLAFVVLCATGSRQKLPLPSLRAQTTTPGTAQKTLDYGLSPHINNLTCLTHLTELTSLCRRLDQHFFYSSFVRSLRCQLQSP